MICLVQSLYTGFADGLTGFVTKPYREAKTDGAAGFAKGFAKGSVELFSKPGAGKQFKFMGLLFSY